MTGVPVANAVTIDLAGLFDRYARQLLAYCARRVGPDVAEDIVAETFLAAQAGAHRFDPDRAQPLLWLYGIATNLIRRHWRAEVRAYRAMARAQLVEQVDDGMAQRAAERSDAAAARRRLAAALSGLPRRQRDVLLLFAVAELEYAEVAVVLGIPVGSVRSALHRARTKVRAALEGGHP
jgi:RNA polymerase sigma factor (sigma-70 family)